jgi:hypothetical protein
MIRLERLFYALGVGICLGSCPQICAGASEEAAEAERPATVAFLGVLLVNIPEGVRYHAPSLEGGGLMVEGVKPGSPAEAVGLKKYDLLAKFGDLKVFSAEHFVGLMKNQKPGDEVTLEILRSGQSQKLTVKLEACVEAPDEGKLALQLEVAKMNAARRLLEFFGKDSQLPQAYPQFLELLVADASVPELTGQAPDVECATLGSIADAEGKIEVKVLNGLCSIRIENPHGQLLYQGKCACGKELQTLPAEFHARFEQLKQRQKAVAP